MMASLNALLAKWLGSGVAATARLGWPLKLTGGALDGAGAPMQLAVGLSWGAVRRDGDRGGRVRGAPCDGWTRAGQPS